MEARAKSLPDRPVPPKASVSTNDKAFVALAAEDRSSRLDLSVQGNTSSARI